MPETAASPQQFPDLPIEIEDALRASIQRFGVLVPVVTDQSGRILDGRHRARIAAELGVSYRSDVLRVASDEEATVLQHTLNADRRHLSREQRQELVAHLRSQGHSYRAIAAVTGVDEITTRRDFSSTATNVAVEPERIVGRDGRSRPARRPTVVTAKNQKEAMRAQAALSHLEDSPEGAVWDVKRAERVAREAHAQFRRDEPPELVTVDSDIEIRVGDFRSVLSDLYGAVDVIISDPPYGKEYLPLYSDLSRIASQLLTPEGILAIMVGQLHLADYLAKMGEYMAYRWCGAYITQGPRTRIFPPKIGTGWKPLLIYTQVGEEPREWLLDDLFDSESKDKDHHDWGQSKSGMTAIVSRLSQPGQLVVDPFLGGGTTAVICQQLGRRFAGCDVNPEAASAARERLRK